MIMNASWCLLSIEGQQIKASIRHRGRGKFEIIEDADSGRYVGKIIDASDVLSCNISYH
jgi:hypothetical protein